MLQGRAILKRQRISVPEVSVVSEVPYALLEELSKQPVAFDLETHGVDPLSGSIRSIGLSNDAGCVAIDLEALSPEDRKYISTWLLSQQLIAHNMVFDGAWVYAKTGKMPTIEACTLVLFKTLSTEGYIGQQWGLKIAMTEILGWTESNEHDLYAWLKANGKTKGQMAQAPWYILGKYNALDAAATWQLYKYFMSVMEKNRWFGLISYNQEEIPTITALAIEQQIEGITVDLELLNEYGASLDTEIDKKRLEFLQHTDVVLHVKEYQEALIQAVINTKPQQFTKKGTVAANFLKWEKRVEDVSNRVDFNIDSTKHLQWLLYEKLGINHSIKTDKGDMAVGKKALPYLGELGKLLKQYRKLRDKRKFVSALNEVQVDGVLHPRIKVHGTVTGRNSGGSLE